MMTVEEYLRTSFEDGDCEYVDGEIVGRTGGDLVHSRAHAELIGALCKLNSAMGLRVLPSIRTRTGASRFRVPDIGVWLPGDIGRRIPTVPPFLIVEVLCEDDCMTRMKMKVEEYLSVGTQWIWLVDPEARKAFCYSQGNTCGFTCDVLRTENPAIEIPLEQVLQD